MLQATEGVEGFEPMADKSDTVTKTIRVPSELSDRLAAFAKAHAKATRVPVSQNAALVLLLDEALAARGYPAPEGPEGS